MPTMIEYTNPKTCGQPYCKQLARVTIRAEIPGATHPLDVPSCLRHESQLAKALALLGYDTEHIVHPTQCPV